MPRRILYLIRNAEYNRTQIDKDGNAPLTERGERQAQLTGHALKDLPIERIFVSPHQQTIETADIISQNMNDTELVIRFELSQYSNIENTHDTKSLKPKVNSEQEHLEKAYRQFFVPPDALNDVHQVLVSYGNIVLDLICYATQVNPEIWAHMLINNTGISIVSIDSEHEIELSAFNDVRHLPGDIRTE